MRWTEAKKREQKKYTSVYLWRNVRSLRETVGAFCLTFKCRYCSCNIHLPSSSQNMGFFYIWILSCLCFFTFRSDYCPPQADWLKKEKVEPNWTEFLNVNCYCLIFCGISDQSYYPIVFCFFSVFFYFWEAFNWLVLVCVCSLPSVKYKGTTWKTGALNWLVLNEVVLTKSLKVI